jgi:Na+/melibiose symporter-like transporter
MTTLGTIVWTVLVPLVQQGPDPSKVKPGWLAFGIVLALIAAVALLGMSLRKHLKRVNFDEDAPAASRGPRDDFRSPQG